MKPAQPLRFGIGGVLDAAKKLTRQGGAPAKTETAWAAASSAEFAAASGAEFAATRATAVFSEQDVHPV